LSSIFIEWIFVSIFVSIFVGFGKSTASPKIGTKTDSTRIGTKTGTKIRSTKIKTRIRTKIGRGQASHDGITGGVPSAFFGSSVAPGMIVLDCWR
jgi:hypothetical protein